MGIRFLLLGAAICLGIAAPACAADYDGLTMDELKAILAAKSMEVTDIDGDTIKITDGPLLELTQCDETGEMKCYEVKIFRNYSNVHPPLVAVNKWNWTTKIPEASISTDEGDPKDLHMELWLTTVGMSDDTLSDTIGWFENSVNADETVDFWMPYIDKDDGAK